MEILGSSHQADLHSQAADESYQGVQEGIVFMCVTGLGLVLSTGIDPENFAHFVENVVSLRIPRGTVQGAVKAVSVAGLLSAALYTVSQVTRMEKHDQKARELLTEPEPI